MKDRLIREARIITTQTDNSIKAATFTTSKAPTRGNLVIPGTEKKKDDDGKTGPQNGAPSDADLFTSVVGVDAGNPDLFSKLCCYLAFSADEIEEDDDNVHAFQIKDDKIDVGF